MPCPHTREHLILAHGPEFVTVNFFDLDRQALQAWCAAEGFSPVHARTLMRQAYKKLDATPWLEPSLPRPLVAAAQKAFVTTGPRLATEHVSAYDASIKFLVRLDDGTQVEAVLMPEKSRLTLCLSSQVGCAQACVFCHTGRMGLTRNLTQSEIIGQVLAVSRWLEDNAKWLAAARLPRDQTITNLVFMGMGEPLDNVDAVSGAITTMTDPWGLALGLARISVSTAGHVDGINNILDIIPKARLALSIHSAIDSTRSRLMPINRRWPLAEVVDTLRRRLGPLGTPVMFQYTLINGVNDHLEDAEALAALAAGLSVKINLIPLNEVGASRLRAPPPERIQAFRDVLHAKGLRVMVRYSKGQDIAAACGQLIVKEA